MFNLNITICSSFSYTLSMPLSLLSVTVGASEVKEFDCNLTREMVDLIDREADMLNRGRPEKSFVGGVYMLSGNFS